MADHRIRLCVDHMPATATEENYVLVSKARCEKFHQDTSPEKRAQVRALAARSSD